MSQKANLEFADARFKAGTAKNGFIPIWVVDEHGCLLHTEPVCTVPEDYHCWFVEWLESRLPERKYLAVPTKANEGA